MAAKEVAAAAGAGWIPPREDEAEARGAERAEVGRFPQPPGQDGSG